MSIYRKKNINDMNSIVWLILSVLLISCSQQSLELSSNGGFQLSGRIASSVGSMFSKASSLSSVGGLSCSTITVKVFRMNDQGEKVGEALGETTVDSQGKFTLDLKKSKVEIQQGVPKVPLIIEATGCSESYIRYVTGLKEQNFTNGSTLLSYIQETDSKDKMKEILESSKRQSLEALVASAASASNPDQAYNIISQSGTLSATFTSLFGVGPEILKQSRPKILDYTIPSSGSEGTSLNLNVTATHWDPDFNVAYLWKLDNTIIATNNSYQYPLTANLQGTHTLSLYVGQALANGTFDSSKPYHSMGQTLTVGNELPPVAPIISVGANTTSNLSVTINISTGVNKSSCASFSKMALTEGGVVAPVNSSDYSLICSTAGTQSETFLLDPTDGLKTIYIWVMDASGNINLTPSTVQFVLDRTGPSLSISTPTSGTTVASPITLNGSCEDSLPMTFSGTGLAATVNTNCSNGSFSQSLNLSNGDGTKSITLSQSDTLGNSSSVTHSLIKDNTAPTISITSPANGLSIQNSITLQGTCEIGTNPVQISGDILSITSTSCASNGQFSINLDLSIGDGNKVVTISQNDDLNNSSSASITVVKDSVAPTLTQTTATLISGIYYSNNNTATFGGACETGTTLILSGEESNTFSCTNNAWSLTTANHTSDGNYIYTLTAQDSAGNTSQINWTWTRDTQAPTLTSVLINNGDADTGSTLVNLSISLTNNLPGNSWILLSEATQSSPCDISIVTNSWQVWTSGTNYPIQLTVSDGVKKVCVWSKDFLGNISTHSPTTGQLGVTADTIDYFVGNPPIITSLTVSNNSAGGNFGTSTYTTGDSVRVDWQITDVEGLNNSPVNIYYSTTATGNWTSIVSNYGSLTGNPTSYNGSYTTFTAPSGIFRIKLVAFDKNGNSSVPAISDVQNGGAWSIYMGTRDVGLNGQALSVSMNKATFGMSANQFAIHPSTNDIYAISNNAGIYKMDARTGLVSLFMTQGASNFANNISIPSNLTGQTGTMQINFDSHGKLYISNPTGTGNVTNSSVQIYQLDLVANTMKLYLGGGSLPGAGNTLPTTPSSAFVTAGSFDFDNNNTLYYFTDCTPGGTWVGPSNTLRIRLMKVTQDANGNAETYSIIAGDCTSGTPTSGADALNTNLGNLLYKHIRQIAVNADGSLIYITDSNLGGTYKLIKSTLGNYQIYNSSIPNTRGIVFDRIHNQVFAASGAVYKVTLDANPQNSETITTYVAANGTGDCNSDGVSASSSCVNATGSNGWAPLEMTPTGNLLFTDSVFRIRYIDSNQQLRTLMGSKTFFGDGMNRSLARGLFQGIYYKSQNINTTDFPIGLYFVDSSATILGYVSPTTNNVSVIAGNQQGLSSLPSNNTVADKYSNLGPVDGTQNFMSLTMDSNGYPITVAYSRLIRLGAQRKINVIFGGGASFWPVVASGTSSSTINMTAFGLGNLIAYSTTHIFSFGHDIYLPRNPNLYSRINFLNLTDSKLYHLMGGSTLNNTQAAAGDSNVSATVNSSPLAGDCYGTLCYVNYNSTDGKLYFSEGNNIRTLSNPTSTATVTLETPANLNMGRIVRSFIFSPDNTRIYYASGGFLYCKYIGGGGTPSNCQNTSLGPPTGVSIIGYRANQFSWIADGQLLISNGPEVYLYTYTP